MATHLGATEVFNDKLRREKILWELHSSDVHVCHVGNLCDLSNGLDLDVLPVVEAKLQLHVVLIVIRCKHRLALVHEDSNRRPCMHCKVFASAQALQCEKLSFGVVKMLGVKPTAAPPRTPKRLRQWIDSSQKLLPGPDVPERVVRCYECYVQ